MFIRSSCTTMFVCLLSLLLLFPHWTRSSSSSSPTSTSSTPTPSSTPSPRCQLLLETFASKSANYSACVALYARPVAICINCRKHFWQVHHAYKAFVETKENEGRSSCLSSMSGQDRMQIVPHMYELINGHKGFWQQGFCEDCFEGSSEHGVVSSVTERFLMLHDRAVRCFDFILRHNEQQHEESDEDNYDEEMMREEIETRGEYNNKSFEDSLTSRRATLGSNCSSPCCYCRDEYYEMKDFYFEHIFPLERHKPIENVCIDVQDKFNLTSRVWSDKYDCFHNETHHFYVLTLFLAVVIIWITTITAPGLILPKLGLANPSKHNIVVEPANLESRESEEHVRKILAQKDREEARRRRRRDRELAGIFR